jgi:hypothetical protein
MPPASAAQGQEQGENPNFRGKTYYAASGSGEEESYDGQESEDSDRKAAFAPNLAEDQRNQSDRNDQLGESRKMIAIHIGTKRNAAKAHFAKPIQFAVKREVLKNAEDGNEKSEEHHKPDETAPVVRGAKQLRGKK